jgi:hypothetical protein
LSERRGVLERETVKELPESKNIDHPAPISMSRTFKKAEGERRKRRKHGFR